MMLVRIYLCAVFKRNIGPSNLTLEFSLHKCARFMRHKYKTKTNNRLKKNPMTTLNSCLKMMEMLIC